MTTDNNDFPGVSKGFEFPKQEPLKGPPDPFADQKAAREQQASVPFTGVQPEDVKGFPMTPEITYRNLQDSYKGHRDLAILTANEVTVANIKLNNALDSYNDLVADTTMSGSDILRGNIFANIIAKIQGPDEKTLEAARNIVADAKNTLIQAEWKNQIVLNTYGFFIQDMVDSVDDLMNTKRRWTEDGEEKEGLFLPANLQTPEMRDFAASILAPIQSEYAEIKGKVVPAVFEKPTSNMVNVDDLTVGQILKNMQSVTLPDFEGLRASDIRATLVAMGYDTTELDKDLADIRSELEMQLSYWTQLNNNAAAAAESARKKMDLSLMERGLMLVTQPALAMGEMFETWRQKVGLPFAFQGVYMTAWIGGKLGVGGADLTMADLKSQYRKAQNEGHSDDAAMAYAYDSWDTNWWAKLAGEVLFDPITYIDLGLGLKVLSLLPKTGKFSRMYGVLGGFERGYNRAADMPIRFFAWISKGGAKAGKWSLGRSIEGMAAVRGRQTGMHLLGAAQQQLNNPMIASITPEQVSAAGLAGIQKYLKSPRVLIDNMSKFGADLWNITRAPFTKVDLDNLILRLGGDAEVTDEMWYTAVELLALTDDTDAFPMEVIARNLAELLGSDNDMEAMRFIREMMDNHFKASELVLKGKDLNAILKKVGRTSEDYYKIAFTGVRELEVIAGQQGAMTGMMRNMYQTVSGSRIASFYTKNIDRAIVIPLARQVLLFGGYAPMNLVESMIRVSVAGYAPWQGWVNNVMSHRGMSALFLTDVPFHLLPEEIALGPMSRDLMEMALEAPNTTGMLWTEKLAANIPGLTRDIRFKNTNLGSMQSFNDWAARVSTEHRAYMYRQMYKSQLAIAAPGEMAKISTAVGKLVAKDYPSLSKEEIRGLQTMIELTALTSPDLVRGLQVNQILLSSRKLVADASTKLDELGLIDEFAKRAILDVIRSGQMTNLNSSEILEEVLGKMMEGHVGKLFRSGEHISKIAADLETWVPEDSLQMIRMIDQLRQLENDVIPRAVEDAYAATTVRGRQILSNPEREALHAESQNLIRNFITESEVQVKNMHKRLKLFEHMLDEDQIVALNNRLVSWESRIVRLRETRNKSFEVLSRYARQGPRLKSPEGWEAAYAESKVFWDEFWIEDGLNMAENTVYIDSLSARQPVVDIRPMMPEMKRGLTLEHVAAVYGISPDQITNNLMSPETATLMGRERFISTVRGRAAAAADRSGIKADSLLAGADDLGFSNDAVGQVYDNILTGMGIDPADIPQMGPMAAQVRGFGQNYNDLYDSRMVPMDDVQRLNDDIGDIATRLQAVDTYNEITLTPGWKMPKGTYIKTTKDDLSTLHRIMDGDVELGHVTITRYGEVPQVESFFPEHPMPTRMELMDELGVNKDAANELMQYAQTDLASIQGPKEVAVLRANMDRIAIRYGADPDVVWKWAMRQRDAIEKAQQKALKPMLKALADDIGMGNTFDSGQLLTGGERLMKAMHKDGIIEHIGATAHAVKKAREFGDIPTYWDQTFKFIKMPDVIKPPTAEVKFGPTAKWQATREEAAKAATNEYYQAFTQYGDQSMFGAFMKKIYPFWTYESQRLPWLAQSYMRRPTLGLNMNRYMDYTDGGYVRLPLTDLEVNPFRGTVFMGGMRRLWVKDFPEYYDSFPYASGTMDYFSRYGFYPNTGIGIALSTFGTKVNGKPEYGELLAPWVRTALNLGASVPNKPGAAVQWFRDKMFPDRFRSYLISQKAIMAGEKGMDIFAKIELNIPLTAAEKQVWADAERYISWTGLLMEQTGMMRFRPEERDEAYAKAEEMMAEILEVEVELIQKIRRYYPVTGKSVFDLFSMTPAEMAKVYEMEEYMKWNSGLITPLLPSEWRAQDTKRILYFAELDKIDKQANVTGFSGFAEAYDFATGEAIDPETPISHEWLDRMLRAKKIDGNTFNNLSGELYAMASAQKTAVSNQELFKDVPKTLEERRIRREERGKGTSTYHPAQELIWLYHEVSPVFDAAEATYDWDTYFMQQSAILGAVPQTQKAEFEANLMKDWTISRKRRWRDYKEYMQPYYSVRLVALQQFTPEQVELIETYKAQPGSIEGARIRELEMFDPNTKLIAHYEAMISQGHENIRKFDPTTDGVLRYWGVVTTSVTPQGEEEYKRLLREYR